VLRWPLPDRRTFCVRVENCAGLSVERSDRCEIQSTGRAGGYLNLLFIRVPSSNDFIRPELRTPATQEHCRRLPSNLASLCLVSGAKLLLASPPSPQPLNDISMTTPPARNGRRGKQAHPPYFASAYFPIAMWGKQGCDFEPASPRLLRPTLQHLFSNPRSRTIQYPLRIGGHWIAVAICPV
jgi:hypothetical protein